ncbi:MAG TPA: response regulator [Segetibacter sp.]
MKHNLLIVEENSAIHYVLTKILCTKYDVTSHLDSYSALKDLEYTDIQLMILNIDTVNSANFGFLVHLHSSAFYSHIPIVVISSNTDIELKVACLELRIEAFFLKPFDPLILLETINHILFMPDNFRGKKEHYKTKYKSIRNLQIKLNSISKFI